MALMIFSNSRTGFAAAAVLALWMFVFLPKHFPKIIIVSVLTALISISWWFNNWTGFVYPDRNSPSQHIEIGTFKTLEKCRNVAVLTLKNNGWANKGDFECGLDYNISAIFTGSLFQNPIQFLEAQTQNNFLTLGNERISLLSNGYQMFLDYPIFGAGLSASINETNRVIHNLYLWIFLGKWAWSASHFCYPSR